ncbi:MULTISPECIES: hypothetical protein [unclassified Streptomyces]|uniref:mechanosensitive ion channel family protein n=1 Tax=unclassified Streptomyces TaxID=2593676 RepID=UPI0036478AC4
MSQPLALSIDFGQGITEAWSAVARFIPKFIAFLLILLIGWFVARMIAKVADRLLRRVGFEKLSERSGVARTLEGSRYDATGIIVRIVRYAILLMALQLGFGVFGPNPVSDMIDAIVAWLPKAIVACVIVVVAMAIARAVRDIVTGALGSASYARTLGTAAWAFVVGLGVIAALGQAEIATSVTGPVLIAVLATIAGVVIVGVGGGLIQPMRHRWERWLAIAESEAGRGRVTGPPYERGRAGPAARQPPYDRERPPRAADREPGIGGEEGRGDEEPPVLGDGRDPM